MKGLLIKDAILIKKYCILNFAISVLFFAISVMDPENILFALVSVVLISRIPITINAYDEQFKWNLFEAALPINRKTVVLEKYRENVYYSCSYDDMWFNSKSLRFYYKLEDVFSRYNNI